LAVPENEARGRHCFPRGFTHLIYLKKSLNTGLNPEYISVEKMSFSKDDETTTK